MLAGFIAFGQIRPTIQQPDTDFITLTREECLGMCPVYSVTVYSTGDVEYIGREFVRVIGRQLYSIPKNSVAYLFHKAEEIGFFSLKAEYVKGKGLLKNKNGSFDTCTVSVSDLPAYYVMIKIGDRKKSVLDYFRGEGRSAEEEALMRKSEAPKELHDFEDEIDRIAHTIDFIKK